MLLQKYKAAFVNSLNDDAYRRMLVFRLLTVLVGVTALFMTAINVATAEWMLAKITLGYSALCLVNFLLANRRWSLEDLIHIMFILETSAMLMIFTITGQADGFSVMWNLVVPACTMAIFGVKRGTVFSAVTLSMILFLFWTPPGRSLLQYTYNDTTLFRFPFLYLCMYAIALYIEIIRRHLYRRLKEAEQNYKHLYRHDALTSLYSRHVFNEEAEEICREDTDTPLSIIMLDIDDFKQINDLYGHNTGDAVLRRVADIIRDNTCARCRAFRWGGEEFLVILHRGHDAAAAAERIRTQIEESEIPREDGDSIRFTVSIGVSRGMVDNEEALTAQIAKADRAMYQAKSGGKNRSVVSGE